MERVVLIADVFVDATVVDNTQSKLTDWIFNLYGAGEEEGKGRMRKWLRYQEREKGERPDEERK